MKSFVPRNYKYKFIKHFNFFTGHIFFDDAFEAHGRVDDYDYKVNNFVKSLVKTMDIAAR